MFGPINFMLRWLFTLFLVFATYNPSGRSFFHWATSGQSPATTVATAAIMLIASYAFLIRATRRSIGLLGVLLAVTFLVFFNVMLGGLGLVAISSERVIVMGLVSISMVLAVGVSFSAIRARLSGQIDSDDIGRRTL
jgi:hypothetical protein